MLRVRLRTKVLIPVALMILAVIVVSLFVVNQVVRRQVLQSLSHELDKSRRIFNALQQNEKDLLLERSWVIAETPQLKAAVDTGDSTTVQHVADDMLNTLGSDVLLVIDRDGALLARNGVSADAAMAIHKQIAPIDESGNSGEIKLVRVDHQSFRVFPVPILTQDEISGVYLLGTVLICKIIDTDYLKNAQNLVECELAFVHNNQITAGTLNAPTLSPPALSESLRESGVSFALDVGEDEYLAVGAGLQNEFLLLRSVNDAFMPIMQPIERTMLFMAGFAILAALLISTFISYGIVSPVEKLVVAAERISAGDYEFPIAVNTQDEIGRLAMKFDEMRVALQQKIAQLNERNVELEEALRKLETAQEELVRTERLAATGKITAQLSHELNNPIHNIRSCLEAVQKRIAQDAPAREFVDLAHDEVLRIGKLTRQMLDFYRPYAGDREKVNVNQILNDLVKLSGSGGNGKIGVKNQLSSEQLEVTASADHLKQVFLNLYMNAVDAMPDGGNLTISSFRQNGNICVVFEDTGCGIPKENLDKIFDAFFTTKAQASGVGLGLSVTYGVIQNYGGSICVESEVGRGSKFVVQLPGETETKA